MLKEYIIYNKAYVFFIEMSNSKSENFCSTRFKINKRYDICPFCKTEVKSGDIFLIFNNWKLFPNISVHSRCCSNFSTKTEAIKFLEEDYKKAVSFKCWFPK